MPPLIDRDSLAGEVVVAAVLFPIAAELVATYAGRLRDESGRRLRLLGGSLREVLLLRRPGDVDGDADRRAKRLVVAAVRTGLILGTVLRRWSILTLGTFFRRDVMVETGQAMIRQGPYRWCGTRATPAHS